jgi:hypothetical protein
VVTVNPQRHRTSDANQSKFTVNADGLAIVEAHVLGLVGDLWEFLYIQETCSAHYFQFRIARLDGPAATTSADIETNLNGYEGTESVAEGSREVMRVALLGPGGTSGTFTRRENATIPW